ncbi:helix-turn-helix domain-containing protein [Cryobacterium flavum]|uniref:helix-turn-helix domain-containing protein n=1 Tax=Cryobacterium flavum TaxID=1424659 RepID=UPI0018E0804E|nr:helix-turn-helix domain-containing protein [Cryobacterium flavum]
MPADVDVMAAAITTLFHPHVEVVLHDMARDRVVAIWNAFSARKPGAKSLLDPGLLADVPPGQVLGPYEQVDRHGRLLSSVTVRLDEGRLLLCFNFDRSTLDSAALVLAAFAAPLVEQPEALFHRDWRAHLNRVIDDWCRERGAARTALQRGDRLTLVADLDKQGVFDTRNAAAHVAAVLDVSRATVYALRKESQDLREREGLR